MTALRFRLAEQADYPYLRTMLIDGFEPITWFKPLDAKYGPLNGYNWHDRWEQRLDNIFATQIILAGEAENEIVAAATGTADPLTLLGFIDILGVHPKHQGKGYGRAMLQGMLEHFRRLGMRHATLECLTSNERGNALYASEQWEIVTTSHRWFKKL